MDHGINGKRIHMKPNKRELEQNTHQETRSMDEEHTRGTIISLFIHLLIFTSDRIDLSVCLYIALCI